MAVTFGINPITWTNDDLPELGGDIPLETCLRETREAGYSGTELGGKFPRRKEELGPILMAHGLKLVSGWYDGHILLGEVAAEFDAMLPHLTLLRDLGCMHVIYADVSHRSRDMFVPLTRRPHLSEEDWAGYGRKLTDLAERAASFGVGIAFHHHMGTIVQTGAEIDRLMANTGPAVGLLFDSGHCLFGGADPLAVLRRHVRRVVHVHCKDVRRTVLEQVSDGNGSFMQAVLDGVFTVPGDGCIDFAALLRVLRQQAYTGWLVVEAEQDPRKAHPLTYAQMGYQNLHRMATEAGFAVS
jgi:inosose dehydratase